jgi:hypothetical protein
VPSDQWRGQRLGDLFGKDGFAGSRLAFDKQRPLEDDRRIHRDLQIFGRHIRCGSIKTHEQIILSRPRIE